MRRWLELNANSLRVMGVLVKVMPISHASYFAIVWGNSTCCVCSWLEHNLNALHVMCRLSKIMPIRHARSFAQKWEKVVHPFLYW